MENTQFVIVGMAGSGKTTFCQRVVSWIMEHELKQKVAAIKIKSDTKPMHPIKTLEIVNMDPAVANTKIPPTIDIRDHVDFKEVMEKYDLGPNGAMLTCLNLFLLKKIDLYSKKYTVVDAPGQIDAFTWCSPAKIIYKRKNTMILYVIDVSDEISDYAMLSNLIFAATLKHKNPDAKVMLVFNKIDLCADKTKPEKYLDSFYVAENTVETDVNTLSVFFSEFYEDLPFIKVSSKTGEGKKEFFDILDTNVTE